MSEEDTLKKEAQAQMFNANGSTDKGMFLFHCLLYIKSIKLYWKKGILSKKSRK